MLLALVHAAATWSLVGLIWFVQLVHYPLMGRVGRAEAAGFAAAHQRRIALLVTPLMLTEAFTALALVANPPAARDRFLPALGLTLLVFIWASTAMLQMPMHGRLLAGADPAAHRRLVRTNWIRTLLWSLRGLVAAVLVLPAR